MKSCLMILMILLLSQSQAAELATEHLAPTPTLAPATPSPWLSGWTLDGQIWNLEKAFPDQTIRRTALVFWATWCAPCKEGLRELTTSAEQLAAAGVDIVLINLDRDQATVERFLATYPTPFPCVLDPYQKNTRRYFGLAADDTALTLPRTVLLDRDRMVEAVFGREGDDYLALLLAE